MPDWNIKNNQRIIDIKKRYRLNNATKIKEQNKLYYKKKRQENIKELKQIILDMIKNKHLHILINYLLASTKGEKQNRLQDKQEIQTAREFRSYLFTQSRQKRVDRAQESKTAREFRSYLRDEIKATRTQERAEKQNKNKLKTHLKMEKIKVSKDKRDPAIIIKTFFLELREEAITQNKETTKNLIKAIKEGKIILNVYKYYKEPPTPKLSKEEREQGIPHIWEIDPPETEKEIEETEQTEEEAEEQELTDELTETEKKIARLKKDIKQTIKTTRTELKIDTLKRAELKINTIKKKDNTTIKKYFINLINEIKIYPTETIKKISTAIKKINYYQEEIEEIIETLETIESMKDDENVMDYMDETDPEAIDYW